MLLDLGILKLPENRTIDCKPENSKKYIILTGIILSERHKKLRRIYKKQ